MRFCYEWEKGGMTMGLSQKDGAPDQGPAFFRARNRPGKAGNQKAAPEGNGSSCSASGAFIFYK